MREHLMPIKITIPFPYGKPDKNGNVYTEEAVQNAVNYLHKNLPIIFRDNSSNSIKDFQLLGHTTGDCHTVTWDSENQVCEVTVDGVIYAGGTNCLVHSMKDNKVTSFEITSFGISVPASGEKFGEAKK